jgi:hypothetical protein
LALLLAETGRIAEALTIAAESLDASCQVELLRALAGRLKGGSRLRNILTFAWRIAGDDARSRLLACLVGRLSTNEPRTAVPEVSHLGGAGGSRPAQGTIAEPRVRLEDLGIGLAVAEALPPGPGRDDLVTALAAEPDEWTVQGVVALARKIVREIDDNQLRSQALARLMHATLEEDEVALAWDVALELKAVCSTTWDEGLWTDVLARIAPRLPSDQHRFVLWSVLALESPQNRARVVQCLIPALDDELLSDAITILQTLDDDDDRFSTLVTLAAGPGDGACVIEALRLVRRLRGSGDQARALVRLAPALPREGLAQAYEIVESLSLGDDQGVPWAEALGSVVARTVELGDRQEGQQRLLSLPDHSAAGEGPRYLALACLAQRLNTASFHPELLGLVRSLQSSANQAAVLLRLMQSPSPPRAPLPVAVGDLLSAARRIGDPQGRFSALKALSRFLAGADLLEALQAAQAFYDPDVRADALGTLAPQLQGTVLGEVIAAARHLAESSERVKLLASLTAHLTFAEREKLRREAKELVSPCDQIKTLALMAPCLPHRLQQQAYQDALAEATGLIDPCDQAEALTLLPFWDSMMAPLQHLGQAVPRIDGAWLRNNALACLVPHLQHLHRPELYRRWSDLLSGLTGRTRRDLLVDLHCLVPVVQALGGTAALTAMFHVVREVGEWWSAMPAGPTRTEGPIGSQAQLEDRLHTLEQRFLALDGPWGAPERQTIWHELAVAYSALGRKEDAAVCWLQALWETDFPPPQWTAAWLRAEIGRPPGELTVEDMSGFATGDPQPGRLRALLAYVLWARHGTCSRAVEPDALHFIHRYLVEHQELLPVRGVWLAQMCMVSFANDPLAAIRQARSRLLQRLFGSGSRPEHDLPTFLRSTGRSGSQHTRSVGHWMINLVPVANWWIKDNANRDQKASTDAYADLIFAFGLARLGEAGASSEVMKRARKALTDKGEVHGFLLEAYSYRITQALARKPLSGLLPQPLLDTLKYMPDRVVAVIDRLRSSSRIVEPDQRISPYRRYLALGRGLAELDDMSDPTELANRVRKRLQGLPKESDPSLQREVLRVALDVAPRVGEEFAREVLDIALPADEAMPEPASPDALGERGMVLERALFVAGHFNQVEHIHVLVRRFEHLLQTQRGSEAAQKLEGLAGECFRGLRKLGMWDEIDRLLGQMATLVLDGRDVTAIDRASMPALLMVAAEWYFFGRDSAGEKVLRVARDMLTHDDPLPDLQQTKLACAYARAAAQAPVSIALKLLEEIFTEAKGVRDMFTSSTHFLVSQLELVESVVLAVTSEDFTLGRQLRRWLDEDEFLVRRRIHHEARVAATRLASSSSRG